MEKLKTEMYSRVGEKESQYNKLKLKYREK